MPDITMCKDDTCKLKDKCYRFKAIPNKRYQSYFVPEKIDEECDMFIKD